MTEHSSTPGEESMSFTKEEDEVRMTLAYFATCRRFKDVDIFEAKVARLHLKSDKWLVFLERCRIMAECGARWSFGHSAWVTEEGSSVDLQDTCVTLDGKRVKYKISQKILQERLDYSRQMARAADLDAGGTLVFIAWLLMLLPGAVAFGMIKDSIGLILPEWSVAALALLALFGPLVCSIILKSKAKKVLESRPPLF